MNKTFVLFLVVMMISSALFSQQDLRQNNKKLNILFIGNSLTYTNNLPQLVKKYGKRKGIAMTTKMVAFANYAIEDHWRDGHVKKLVSSERYDFVILQQGPSSQSEGRKMLIDYGEKYEELCKLNGAKLGYFMVWPSLKYYHTFDDVIKNHEDAAALNNAIIFPVGQLWKEYIDATNNNEYYSSDGFHPSKKGSEMAAEVIIEYLLQY